MSVPRRETTRQDYYRRMARVLDHIHRNLNQPLSLAELARVACFSPYHFHYVFRGMVGEGLGEYLRRVRLERAWYRLREEGVAISELAREAGYGSHEAFARAFKAHFAMTPGEARDADVETDLRFAQDGRLSEALAARLQRLLQDGGDGSDGAVEIRRLEPARAAAMRQVGPYHRIGALFGKLMAWAGRHGVIGPETRVLGLCYDDPETTPPEKCRYDACLALGPGQRVPEGSGLREILIQGGEYAVTVHRGPHCELPRTYALVCGEWCPQFGRELRDVPCIEHYLNRSWNVPAEDLRTEIYVPLEAES